MSDFTADLLDYVGLTLDDRRAADMIAAAKALAPTRLPGYEWQELSLPAAVIEVGAYLVEELIFAVNRLPNVMAASMGTLAGVEPSVGTPGTVQATLTLTGPGTTTIPAGTLVVYEDEADAWQFSLDADVTITSPATTGVGAFTGLDRLSAVNSIPAGTSLRIVSSVSQLATVVTLAQVAGATDPETSDEYLRRVALRAARRNELLGLPRHFEAYAAEFLAGNRAQVISLYDGLGGPPYVDAGHTTVVVRGATGNLSTLARVTLQAEMQARVPAGVEVHVIDPTYTTVDVTVTVAKTINADGPTVQTAVVAAVNAFLDPATWPWSGTVRRTDLIAVIENVPGVDFIVTLVPAVDVLLGGDGPLAQAGTVTVTVL